MHEINFNAIKFQSPSGMEMLLQPNGCAKIVVPDPYEFIYHDLDDGQSEHKIDIINIGTWFRGHIFTYTKDKDKIPTIPYTITFICDKCYYPTKEN